VSTTNYSWDFPHFITPAQLAVTPDIGGDGKATSGVNDSIRTTSHVQGFGDQTLVLNPSPPTCPRLDDSGIGDPLVTADDLSKTIRRGALVVINFYAEAHRNRNSIDMRYVATEWVVIAQSEANYVVGTEFNVSSKFFTDVMCSHPPR